MNFPYICLNPFFIIMLCDKGMVYVRPKTFLSARSTIDTNKH